MVQKCDDSSGIQCGAQPAGSCSGHLAWPIAFTIGASGPNLYSIWLPEITTASERANDSMPSVTTKDGMPT